MGIADDLQKLQRLREANALTDAEFQAAKAKILSETATPAPAPVGVNLDPRVVATIAIWGTFSIILIFGVFRMSWHGESGAFLFILVTSGLAGLSLWGTKRVWAGPSRFRDRRFEGEDDRDWRERPVDLGRPPPSAGDPKDEGFRAQ